MFLPKLLFGEQQGGRIDDVFFLVSLGLGEADKDVKRGYIIWSNIDPGDLVKSCVGSGEIESTFFIATISLDQISKTRISPSDSLRFDATLDQAF